jgi:hypothetical protein
VSNIAHSTERETALLLHEVARLSKLSVNPVVNSVGSHTHKPRVRLAGGDGVSDLELPFP